MKKFYYNKKIDFTLFINIISNRDLFNIEINSLKKNSPYSFDDEALLNYIEFINYYYNNLSFIEKKFLETYFNNTKVFSSFLIYLFFRKLSFKDIQIESFIKYLKSYYSIDATKKGSITNFV